MMSLRIKKRGGDDASFNPQKIYQRIKRASKGLSVNSDEIFIKVITSVPTEGVITTKDLDKLIYEIAAAFTGSHHDYSRLASSVAISSYHKETDPSFSNTMHTLHVEGVVSNELMAIVESYGPEKIDEVINHDNDYNFDYFAWRSLAEMYLLKLPDGKVVERPQHMLMRVSLGIHKDDIDSAIETYELMSDKWFTHATPTLFNAGTPSPQMSSCFLLTMKDDSI